MAKTLSLDEKIDLLRNEVAALARLQNENYEDLVERINNLNLTETDYSVYRPGEE